MDGRILTMENRKTGNGMFPHPISIESNLIYSESKRPNFSFFFFSLGIFIPSFSIQGR